MLITSEWKLLIIIIIVIIKPSLQVETVGEGEHDAGIVNEEEERFDDAGIVNEEEERFDGDNSKEEKENNDSEIWAEPNQQHAAKKIKHKLNTYLNEFLVENYSNHEDSNDIDFYDEDFDDADSDDVDFDDEDELDYYDNFTGNFDSVVEYTVDYKVCDKIEDEQLRTQIHILPRFFENFDVYQHRINDHVPLTRDEYDIITKRFPKLFETYDNYNKRLREQGLEPFEINMFICYKAIYPVIGEDFITYKTERLPKYNLEPLSKKEIDKFTLDFPIPGESKQSYLERCSHKTDEDYYGFHFMYPGYHELYTSYNIRLNSMDLDPIKTSNFIDFKNNYPKLTSTYEEYKKIRKQMSLEPMKIEDFKIYKKMHPQPGENNYTVYLDRLKTIIPSTNHKINDSEFLNKLKYIGYPVLHKQGFKLYNTKFPRTLENYENNCLRLEKNDIKLFKKADFEVLKKATVFREETFQEYSSRMELYYLTPYEEEEFESFKFYYPHVGENFIQYWDRLKKKHPQSTGELESEYSERMTELGFLTVDPDVFNEFIKSYPYPYESYSSFKNRISDFDHIDNLSEATFKKLKRILPLICESHYTYINRTRDLGFPALSKVQYNKFVYGLPRVGETKSMFVKRLQLTDSLGQKIEKGLPPISQDTIVNDLFLRSPAETEKSFLIESLQVFDSFNEICPSFFPNFVDYINNTETQNGELLNESEFICVNYHYPKPDQDLKTHNLFLNSKNLQPVTPEFFIILKLIYPQLNHFKYADYENSVSSLTLPTLTEDEFHSYKNMLPNMFDFNYNLYLIRIDSIIFNENNEDRNTETKVPSPYQGTEYWNFIRNKQESKLRRAVKKQPMITMFSDPYHFKKDDFESIKRALYPKRSISFSAYKAEMKNLGLQPLDENIFRYFKELYPAIGEEYQAYTIRVKTKVSKNLGNIREERNRLISLLNKHVMTQNEYTFLKQRMPSQFEQTYGLYVQRMNNSNPVLEPLSEEDYIDIMTTYPQYFESYVDYILKLQELYLEPMSIEIFVDFKHVFPRIILESYDLYLNRITQHEHGKIVSEKLNTPRKMSIDEFTLHKSRIPLQYESRAKYENRMSKMNKESYKTTEFDSLKIIYPKLADTYDNYKQAMKNGDLFQLSLEEFSTFKTIYPGQCDTNYEHYMEHLEIYEPRNDGETDFQYVNRLKGTLYLADLPILSSDEFDEYLAVMPRGNESYTDHSMRIYKNKEKLPIESINRHQFLYFKKLLPLRHENFEEYKQRFKLYYIRPMTFEQFKQFKALFPIIGEQFDEYWDRITSTYPENSYETNEDYVIRIRELGAITKENFNTFMESYPLPYEMYKGFRARRKKYSIDNIDTPEQLKEWFHSLEFLLPRMCEDIQMYTLRTQNLGYPQLNNEQFRRHMYALPQPGESQKSFTKRLINRSAKFLYAEIFNNFTQIAPKFIHTDYKIYSEKIKIKGLEPLNLDEFNCFHKFYPKLNEDNIMYRKKLKTLNLFEVTPRALQLYKKVYPRLHHYDYTIYKLDAIKSSLPMLSEKEFLDYKQKIPRQFDSYHIYTKRHTEKNLSYFTKEEFNEIHSTYYARPTEQFDGENGYSARMNYLALDVMPESHFNYFKGIFPFLTDTYNNYTQRINDSVYPILKNRNEQRTLIDHLSVHILTKEQFGHYQNNFPRLIEVYPDYLKRRQELEKLSPQMKDEFGEFTENMFYDLQDSFYPILGETINDFKFKTLYYPSVENVYKLFIQIYPLIGENRESYNTRTSDLSANSIPGLEYLGPIQLFDDEFQRFKMTFPHPLDFYEHYVERIQKYSLVPVNKDRFLWYNQVFPFLDRDSDYYINLCSQIFVHITDTKKQKSIFDYIKHYYPGFSQSYIEYKDHFDQFLSKSDENLLKNEYADLQNTMKITIMSKEKFDNYKKTLPFPEEDEEKFEIRIQKLGLTPYSQNVILSILETYPNRNESLSDYNTRMEDRDMPQMTNNKDYETFQELLRSMNDDLSAEIDFEKTFEALVSR